MKLPDGMRENERFPEPIITPTTKADEGHDENISKEEIIASSLEANLATQIHDLVEREAGINSFREMLEVIVEWMTDNFKKNNQYSSIASYVKNFRMSSMKLDVIRKQFLRLNDYE